MSKTPETMTKTQTDYIAALEALGFAASAKKGTATMTRKFHAGDGTLNMSLTVKISADDSIKLTKTTFPENSNPKETTQTFFPPASNISTGIVMAEIHDSLMVYTVTA